MNTKAYLTWLAPYVSATLTRTQLLQYVNLAQNKILGSNHPITRVQPDPYFETLDDTYSYVANLHCRTANRPREAGELVGDVRSITRIYALLPNGCGIWGYWGNNCWFGAWDCNVRPEQFSYANGEWSLDARWALVNSSEPMSNDCLIKWQKPNNPGVTAVRWYAETYLWPQQLLTENVPLTVPEDFQTDLLLEAVLSLIERREYGRDDFPRAAYEEALKRFRDKYANTPVQEFTGRVPFIEVP